MKLSVSMPDDDVEFLDAYASKHGVEGRSGVMQRAVSLLRASELGDEYEAAWLEWDGADGALWDTAVGDGLADAAR